MSSIVSRCVSFGNPSLGTYSGKVYTSKENNHECKDVVAMVDVPAEEVPGGVLTFARGHRPNIRHVRVVTTMSNSEEVLIESKSCKTYLILFQLSSSETASLFVSDLHDKPFTSLQDDIKCHAYHVVLLEGDAGVSLMSPFFASTSSSNAASVDTSQNCPVCLELLDTNGSNSSIITTLCNHTFHIDCLLRWQDSPCPVCRYDHSGLHETFSQCHVCGTTDNNYVCLICGVISCSNRHDSRGGHAREHYLNTLHAYALEIDTQYVWDFVGDGFVHRIIQNKEDGKLVEFSDPNTTSNERTLTPGLTDAQQGQVVHRKLEQFASQYYTLLKSQLEQQRIYYEAKLQEIRRQHQLQQSNTQSTTTNQQQSSADFIAALKQDKHTQHQRCSTLRKKSHKLKSEVDFLKNMNDSLQENKVLMQRQRRDTEKEIVEYEIYARNSVTPLEEKLQKLMLQLEDTVIDTDDDRKIPAIT